FKQGCDRSGAIDQGAGGPVNGKKDGDIVQHVRPLSGWGTFDRIMPALAPDFLIYLMPGAAPRASKTWAKTHGERRRGRARL
ncbi:MAG: hypothetical protein WCA28_14025, partial [Bradyrhizobium sp.]